MAKKQKEIKTVVLKDFIKAQKYLDTSGNYVVIEIQINRKLQKLLKSYAVTTDTEALRSCRNQRYLIKNVLLNSNIWQDTFSYLFEKNLLDTGKTKIKLSNLSQSDYILRMVNQLNNFIAELVRLKQKVVLRVNYNTEIEVLK